MQIRKQNIIINNNKKYPQKYYDKKKQKEKKKKNPHTYIQIQRDHAKEWSTRKTENKEFKDKYCYILDLVSHYTNYLAFGEI